MSASRNGITLFVKTESLQTVWSGVTLN